MHAAHHEHPAFHPSLPHPKIIPLRGHSCSIITLMPGPGTQSPLGKPSDPLRDTYWGRTIILTFSEAAARSFPAPICAVFGNSSTDSESCVLDFLQ